MELQKDKTYQPITIKSDLQILCSPYMVYNSHIELH